MNTGQRIRGITPLGKMVIHGFFVSLLALLLFSCNKNNVTVKEKSYLSVRMTDTPGVYNAVMIDLQGVEVTGPAGKKVMLYTNTGIYNLLDYTNGLNTLIASGDLDAGRILQLRMILGPENTVMVDSVVYPLITPDALQAGLKIQLNKTWEPGVSYTILLDFDASQSIALNSDGEYQLIPVVRTLDSAVTGFYNP